MWGSIISPIFSRKKRKIYAENQTSGSPVMCRDRKSCCGIFTRIPECKKHYYLRFCVITVMGSALDSRQGTGITRGDVTVHHSKCIGCTKVHAQTAERGSQQVEDVIFRHRVCRLRGGDRYSWPSVGCYCCSRSRRGACRRRGRLRYARPSRLIRLLLLGVARMLRSRVVVVATRVALKRIIELPDPPLFLIEGTQEATRQLVLDGRSRSGELRPEWNQPVQPLLRDEVS